MSFAGAPNTTYTAIGTHHAYLSVWDYAQTYPYQRYYYDNWYLTSFQSQNIYQPQQYYFQSPGYQIYRRQTQSINLGKTYDSVSLVDDIKVYRGSLQAQGPDIYYGSRRDFGDGVIADGNTVSWSWARSEEEMPVTSVEAIEGLRLINSHLTPLQQDNRRTDAFPCARDFINRCSLNRGCDPASHPRGGQQCQDKNGAHVDVVIYKGLNFRE